MKKICFFPPPIWWGGGEITPIGCRDQLIARIFASLHGEGRHVIDRVIGGLDRFSDLLTRQLLHFRIQCNNIFCTKTRIDPQPKNNRRNPFACYNFTDHPGLQYFVRMHRDCIHMKITSFGGTTSHFSAW